MMKRIVVVVDDAEVVDILFQALLEAGHQVMEFDAHEAVAGIADYEPDCVFLDVTADHVCEQLREIPAFKELPVIAFAPDDAEVRRHLRSSGVDFCVEAPKTTEDADGTIGLLFSEAPGGRSSTLPWSSR